MRFVTFLAVLLSCPAVAQNYVITTKGDTLKGTVKLSYMDKLDQVQVFANKKKTNLTALKVRAIHLEGEIYQPIGFQNTIRFMKLMKPGYLRLYGFRLENQLTFDGRYLLKSDGNGIEVPSMSFKPRLAEFLQDYPPLSEKIRSGTYGRNDLNTIIDEYNAHIDSNTKLEQAKVVETNKSLPRLELLGNLQKSIEAQPEFSSKKDALSLTNDIEVKLKGLQEIPSYMVEALKGFLTGIDAVQGDLTKFADSLKP